MTYSTEARFGISPDINLSKDVLIPPSLTKGPVSVPVLVPSSFMRTVQRENPNIENVTLQTSPRSRWAQLGLDFENTGLQVPDLNKSTLTQDGHIEAVAQVYNYSPRGVALDAGSGLFRLYYDTGARLVNGELDSAFKSGDINIEGEYGDGPENNWDYIRDSRTGNVTGVRMRISKDRKWIAPKQDSYIKISDTARNFREEIAQYLEDAPKTSSPRLWIGKTESKMTLKGATYAVLHPVVMANGNGKATNFSEIGAHLNSRILYPGNTQNWQIILEIISSTIDGEAPEYVDVHFVNGSQK
jgi:hypothetical protein